MRDATDSERGHLDDLVRDVDTLCLDAGNTVVFLDHARLARSLGQCGFATSAEDLIRCEGEAKRLQEEQAMQEVDWAERALPGAAGWGRTVGTIAACAGVPVHALPGVMSKLWAEHVELNFWSLVPEGMGAALDRARSTGVRVAIVSNAEGMLDVLFERLGIARHFDVVIDSGREGVEKPDPKIFALALERAGGTPSRAVHLGDSFATDVLGARAAGLRVALIDPYGQLTGRHADVPRVAGVAEVANALAAQRAR